MSEPSRLLTLGSYNLVHLISMIKERCLSFFKVRGQRSRSHRHIVGKRCMTQKTLSSRIIQLGTMDHHGKWKMSFSKVGGQRSRLYWHIVGNRGRIHCRQDTNRTIRSRTLIHLIGSMIKGRFLFFKVGGQRSRSYFHMVGKRCKQDTEWP